MEKNPIADNFAQLVAENPPETQQEQDEIRALLEEEAALSAQYAAEHYNLAEALEEAKCDEIAREIHKGFETDDESRTEWLDNHAFWLSLYMQADYAETADDERDWGATESIPILTEACDQFQSRTYKTFFPNDTFVSAIPMRNIAAGRKVLEDRAKRIGAHMSYQLGFKDRNYKQDKDALFLGISLHGSFFTKAYYDQNKRKNCVDNVRPTDLVVNYHVGPCRMEDLRRKTHVLYTTVGETQDLANKGFFIEAARAATADGIGKNIYNVKVDETQGLTEPSNNSIKRDAQAVLLEQHFYLDLDGEGEYRPYIGTICAASRKLLRLVINYEATPDGQPLDNYKEIQYFTHYRYKPNPDGFYGLGLGHSIGDMNSAVNIMLRQTMDAATLANDGNMSGFISERLGIEGDDISMIIGKLRKIPDTVNDLSSGIMLMKFPGPNPNLINLMELIDQRAQRLGSTTEATTGTISKVMQPTTLMAQIEQALEAFSSVQMRIANSFSEELCKIYRLNQKHMPLVDYFIVNGDSQMVTRSDYADDMLIQPIFDPKFTTQAQKVARAEAELKGTMENPVNEGRPQVLDAAYRRYFEALDVEDIDELIPPQPQVENFDDQIVENTFFLMPKESRPLYDVFPDQDHAMHLAEMEPFIAQYGQQMEPEQMQDVMKHYQKHTAYLYGQQNGVFPPTGEARPTPPLAAREQANAEQTGQGGFKALAPESNNPMGAGPVIA